MTPTHPTFGQPLFCVPQGIGIYVGWVDVKGFLVTTALNKSTHHSKESTGKLFGGLVIAICLYSK